MSMFECASYRQREEADRVRGSALFNADLYLAGEKDPVAREDAALHYVLVGEAAGRPASALFSAGLYRTLNPDVHDPAINILAHYETHGRREGRRFGYGADFLPLDVLRLDETRPTVLLLLHEATYSGAPILGWNILRELKLTRNVVVVIRRGGALREALAHLASALVEPPPEVADDPLELRRLAERLRETYNPTYAIANSIETRLLAVALKQAGVPLLALVHEFATHARPYELNDFYLGCDRIVFPADVVRRSSLASYGFLAQRRTVILPQGESDVPPLSPALLGAATTSLSLDKLLAQDAPALTVLGLGPIDLRKGVDLFIATATALRARYPELDFRFIWVGDRVHPAHHPYHVFVDEQVARSGVADRVHLAPATDALERVYGVANVLFIASRLDPLPNVGIDAALRGLPILCFEEATGFADLLAKDPETAWLTAPYLDTGAVADILARLSDPAVRRNAGEAVRRVARRTFDMVAYVAHLDHLGLEAAARHHRAARKADVLIAPDAFDAQLYFADLPQEGGRSRPLDQGEALRRYIGENVHADFRGPAVWGHHPRRALPGFHALNYARLNPEFDDTVDPLVHYNLAGQPCGPWRHEVIRLDRESRIAEIPVIRAAVHGHFHYVDNIGDFMEALQVNAAPMDLVLTTTTAEAAEALRIGTDGYGRGAVSIHVFPNIGRDIGPFIRLLGTELKAYDVVGHVHGKKSVHTHHYDKDLGNRWRRFLWSHLLGPTSPAADIIISAFADDTSLGLVFPENDFLVGWEKNRAFAAQLADRIGLPELPEHIEFPVGTMFWARPAALQALVAAALEDGDYPIEPLPIDGTMLHALERLFTPIVEAAGFRYAATYDPRVRR